MPASRTATEAALLNQLAKPTGNYKRHAWLATGGLVGFMVLYLMLAGWFLYTAYRLTIGAGSGADAFLGWVVGICAAFLAVFMLKAIFFVKRGSPTPPSRSRRRSNRACSHSCMNWRTTPAHGWLAYAAGYSDAEEAHWNEARRNLQLARGKLPALSATIAVDLARIQRVTQQEDSAGFAALAKDSEQLRFLAALEAGDKLEADLKAYAELNQGHLEQALQLARTRPEREGRLIRLAAASDGASPAMIEKALALSADKGIDESTLWPSLALAARMKQDGAPYLASAKNVDKEQSAAILQFMSLVQKGAEPKEAERQLDLLPPELRGQAYSMGLILLGKKAPQRWRDGAMRLLFAWERPYFAS